MKHKTKLIAFSLLVFLSANVLNAQTTTKEITDKFFKSYEESPQQAVDYIFGTNKWMTDETKLGIENVKTQLTNFIGLVGDYYGYEKITEKSVGESYKLISYLIKYDRQPIRFTFIFYRPKRNGKFRISNLMTT